MHLSRYLKSYPCQDKPGRVLLLATRRCSVLELSETKLEAIRRGDLSEKERETLFRLGVLVADPEADRQEMLTTFETINITSRSMSAKVVLTLECNLACPYCFEESFRGHLTMSDETADLLVQKLTEQMAAEVDVTVDFYGGEALMRLELLVKISARL